MNSSELLRRREEAAKQYTNYWKPRDASEVTARNAMKANNIVVPSGSCNYYPPPAQAGSTRIQSTSNILGRTVCDTPIGPGNGFDPSYEFTTILNRQEGNTVCGDTNWGTAGGVSLQTCTSIDAINNPVSACNVGTYMTNPVPGMTWGSASNGTLFLQYTGNCPPNNSAQTPHFAPMLRGPLALPLYNPRNQSNIVTGVIPVYQAPFNNDSGTAYY